MKNFQNSQSRNIKLFAIVACATILTACGGGGEYESADSGGSDTNVNDTVTISAAPALLSRTCDGSQSPQLFCPSTNGG